MMSEKEMADVGSHPAKITWLDPVSIDLIVEMRPFGVKGARPHLVARTSEYLVRTP